MLKPSDISLTPPPDTKDLIALREQFDTAIRAAAESGQWPAIVANYRDRFSAAAIATVIGEYRDLGWFMSTSSGCRAVIDHPERLTASLFERGLL